VRSHTEERATTSLKNPLGTVTFVEDRAGRHRVRKPSRNGHDRAAGFPKHLLGDRPQEKALEPRLPMCTDNQQIGLHVGRMFQDFAGRVAVPHNMSIAIPGALSVSVKALSSAISGRGGRASTRSARGRLGQGPRRPLEPSRRGKGRSGGLVPSSNRDRVIERAPRVLRRIDRPKNPSNLDHDRLLPLAVPAA
jgi:hypothetical protein